MTPAWIRTARLVAALVGLSLFAPALAARAQEQNPLFRGVNICEKLVERLVVPATYKTRTTCLSCAIAPHCCFLCGVSPSCQLTEWVIDTAEEIYEAGEVYCSVRDISAMDLWHKALAGVLQVPASEIPGFLEWVEWMIAAHYEKGTPISARTRALIAEMVNPLEIWELPFTATHLEGARILRASYDDFTRAIGSTAFAMTLGDLIVVVDAAVPAMTGAAGDGTWLELQLPPSDPNLMFGLMVLTHELVHVAQYRSLGMRGFLVDYLLGWASYGYANTPFEREGFEFSTHLAERTGGLFCESVRDWWNQTLSGLGVQYTRIDVCPSFFHPALITPIHLVL